MAEYYSYLHCSPDNHLAVEVTVLMGYFLNNSFDNLSRNVFRGFAVFFLDQLFYLLLRESVFFGDLLPDFIELLSREESLFSLSGFTCRTSGVLGCP